MNHKFVRNDRYLLGYTLLYENFSELIEAYKNWFVTDK